MKITIRRLDGIFVIITNFSGMEVTYKFNGIEVTNQSLIIFL